MNDQDRMWQLMKGKVIEFHRAFGQVPTKELQLQLIEEEASEVIEAFGEFLTNEESVENATNVLKELADLTYVTVGLHVILVESGEAWKAPEDKIETWRKALQLAEIFSGVFDDFLIFAAFTRVHQSNMSKLGEDGLPIFREDGKIMKGPNYFKPDLTDLAEEALDNMATERAKVLEAKT